MAMRRRAGSGERHAGVAGRVEHVERQETLGHWCARVAQRWPLRQQPLARQILHPEPRGRNHELAARRQIAAVGDREKGKGSELHAGEARVRVEDNRPAGARFYVDIPATVAAEAEARA